MVSFSGIVSTGLNLALGQVGMSLIGMLGPCVFVSSQDQVRTFSALKRTTSARHVDHEVISQKQVSEFTGADLDEVELTMLFHGDLGVSPESEVEKLRATALNGEPVMLMLGGSFFGKWTIREIPEEWQFMYGNGSAQVMAISVRIREFVDSVPTTAQGKQAQDQASRSETGKGGPERLPGDKAPGQSRNLTAKSGNWNTTLMGG
jgi:phage protein U